MKKEIVIQKLKDAQLLGKGGAAFPTAVKWEGVLNAEGDIKYIICNSSEGELGLFKDLYIWRNYMPMVFRGIEYALEFLGNAEVYIHINENYFNELKPKIFEYINNYRWRYKFHLSIENPCYIGGEASALMNIIENGIAQPRPRIHRTVVKGLFDRPTMMQNVETFYDIARVLDGTYDYSRFSCIFGDGVENQFVHRHGINTSIADILKYAGVNPDFDYYVQVGGSASGHVYNRDQLTSAIVSGVGAVEIFDRHKRDFLQFIRKLGDFYQRESCGKCKGKEFATGLNDLIRTFDTEQRAIENIANIMTFVDNMSKKTFCSLCKSLRKPIVTYCSNILGTALE
jgi:NADH:ubiquinone oxidoreductase subunit F (NADH-binding)